MKSSKSFAVLLYSSVGVVAMGIIVIAVNVLLRSFVSRVDLTEDRLYTLSDGTKNVLKRIETPVQVRFYFSESDPQTPPELKTYASRVEDLLNELELASKGKLLLKKLDPVPDSEAEDSANLDGVQGQQLTPMSGDKLYFGLSVRCLDETATIPLLVPSRERLLEYDLSRAIAQVIKPVKQVIGIMSGLPVFGGGNPMMAALGQGGAQDPWLFVDQLKSDFEVRQVELSAEKIDEDIKLMLVVYPKGISPATEFALDQFVLRGGKLIAFFDPKAVTDPMSRQQNMLQAAATGGASIDSLLRAWGLRFDAAQVVSDKEYASETDGGANSTVLTLTEKAIDANDIATSQIKKLVMVLAGAFEGTPAEGLSKTVLVHSTPNATLSEAMLAAMGNVPNATTASKQYDLVIRLTGKFKTAFPEGPPSLPPDPSNPEKKEETKTEALKESKEDGLVVLFGDADMLHENFYARIQNIFGQRVMMQPVSQNLPLIQNLVEFLSGDKDLINMRSRATISRPFIKIREMQVDAQKRFQTKLDDLQKKEEELDRKLTELARGTEPGLGGMQTIILSDDAKKEIEAIKKQRSEVGLALKTERKNLRRDVDSLQNSLQWTNILAMPLLISLAGIGLALLKRQRTAAR